MHNFKKLYFLKYAFFTWSKRMYAELRSGGAGPSVHILNHYAEFSQGHMAAKEHRETKAKSGCVPRTELIPRPKQYPGAAEISI